MVEILLIGNTAGNLSLALPPLLTVQIRFVTGIEVLSLFHSLEWGGGGGWGGNPDSQGWGGSMHFFRFEYNFHSRIFGGRKIW